MSDWYMEAGGMYSINGEEVFGRKIFIDPDDVDKIRTRFKNKDAYVTIYFYNDKDQDKSDLYGPLYIDLDIEIKSEYDFKKIKRDLGHVVTALNTMYGVPTEYIKLYFSGNKGFHIIVPPEVFGIQPNKKLNHYYKYIAQDLRGLTLFKTVDTRIYDNKRLFRLPNTINGKTGYYKVPVDYEFVKAAEYHEMLEYASTPKEMNFPKPKLVHEASRKFQEAIKKYEDAQMEMFRPKGKVKSGGDLLPCVKKVLSEGASKGNRNNTTVLLASSLFQNGFEIGQVTSMLLEWNSTKNSPKLPDREIINTVKSAEAGFNNGKFYGCSAIKEMGYCIGGNCKVFNKKKQ